jgi:serine/threonine protein phosphatase PrpC
MIPAERAHIKATALTHPGMSGKNNEDSYAVAAFRTEGERPLPVLFAIISDGIGGHRAGEIASEMVVETVSHAVASSNANNPIQTLREAIMRSSQEILVMAESDPEKKGMGATCACAMIVGDRLFIAYVGDSRIYLIRNNKIQQLSIDHTWIQEAIEAGILEPEQGKDHPNAHVIRRYLGSKQPVEPDTRLRMGPGEDKTRMEENQGLHLRPNDRLLLCSDGLTDLVEDHEIQQLIQEMEQEQAVEKLIDLANQRGGHDNITIVILRVPETLPDATQPVSLSQAPAKKKRSAWILPIVGIMALILLLVVAGGIFFFFQRSNEVVISPTRATQDTSVTQPIVLPTASLMTGEATNESSTSIVPIQTEIETVQPALVTPLITLTPWPTNTLAP